MMMTTRKGKTTYVGIVAGVFYWHCHLQKQLWRPPRRRWRLKRTRA